MSHPPRPTAAGRTRAINTMLFLVVLACFGVIFADQNGMLGGNSSVATSGAGAENSGVTVPDLSPSNSGEGNQGTSSEVAPPDPPPSSGSGGYGDIK